MAEVELMNLKVNGWPNAGTIDGDLAESSGTERMEQIYLQTI